MKKSFLLIATLLLIISSTKAEKLEYSYSPTDKVFEKLMKSKKEVTVIKSEFETKAQFEARSKNINKDSVDVFVQIHGNDYFDYSKNTKYDYAYKYDAEKQKLTLVFQNKFGYATYNEIGDNGQDNSYISGSGNKTLRRLQAGCSDWLIYQTNNETDSVKDVNPFGSSDGYPLIRTDNYYIHLLKDGIPDGCDMFHSPLLQAQFVKVEFTCPPANAQKLATKDGLFLFKIRVQSNDIAYEKADFEECKSCKVTDFKSNAYRKKLTDTNKDLTTHIVYHHALRGYLLGAYYIDATDNKIYWKWEK